MRGIFLLVMGALAATPVLADTVTYNFNDNTLDGLNPIVSVGYSYSVSGGAINVKKTDTSPGGGISFSSPLQLTGDFTATVDLSRSLLGTDGVLLFTLSSAPMFVNAYLFDNGIGTNSNPIYLTGHADEASANVTLEINRMGNTVTTAYSIDGGSTFTTIGSGTDPQFGTPATLQLSMTSAKVEDEEGSFDNLTITTGPSVATPLPATAWGGLVLLGGLGTKRLLRGRRSTFA